MTSRVFATTLPYFILPHAQGLEAIADVSGTLMSSYCITGTILQPYQVSQPRGMPDGDIADQHDDFETDSLFGSPPPSPGRGRSPSPLALPGGQNSVQNVGTLALPGSHLYSELPSVPLPAPYVNPSSCVARQRSQPPTNIQQALPLRSSTAPLRLVPPAPRLPLPPRKKKRPSRRTTPASDARPTPPPIELPSPTDPPPANFLRNQLGLLGHAGLVSGVHPANLSLQRHLRGKTPQNPIVVEDEDDRPSIGRRPLHSQTTLPGSRIPVPSSEEILQNLVKQKNLIPVMDALVRLVAGSAIPPPPPPSPPSSSNGPYTASTSNGQAGQPQQPYSSPYYPYPYSYPYHYSYPYGYTYPYAASTYQRPLAPSTSHGYPQTKKRKLSHVPAGATEWDVPYPFPEGQGPPGYHQNWQKLRGQQLVEDLVGLVKSAAKKAAVQKAQEVQGGASSKDGPAIGSVEYYRERILRHYRPHGRYEGHSTLQPVQSPAKTRVQTAAPSSASPGSAKEVTSPASTSNSSSSDRRAETLQEGPTLASQPIPSNEAAIPSVSIVSFASHIPAETKQAVPQNATEVTEQTTPEEGSDAVAANTTETVSDQTLEQITDNTESNIDDLLSIFNDLPAGDIDAFLSSTDFSSINAEDFDFGAAFDMTGLSSTSDGPTTGGSSTEDAVVDPSAADPNAFDIDFAFDPSTMREDFAIDPELLALSHPSPSLSAAISASERQDQPEKPSVQTTANMRLSSGAPPTPTLVSSPLSQVDSGPPTPKWNFQFPEPEIAGANSERAGSETRSEQGGSKIRKDLRRQVLTRNAIRVDGAGDAVQRSKDKGKGRAVEVVDVDREDTPMVVDATPGPPSRGSEAPEQQQFDIPTIPPPPPPPPKMFSTLDILEPLRKTLEAYLPAKSHVPSLLVAPPVVAPQKAPGTSLTQAKDREDILRRARLMRSQLAEEIERAKIELWETTMEGGCLTVLAKNS